MEKTYKIHIQQIDFKGDKEINPKRAYYFPQLLLESGWDFVFETDGCPIHFPTKEAADMWLINNYLSVNSNIDVRVAYTDDYERFMRRIRNYK